MRSVWKATVKGHIPGGVDIRDAKKASVEHVSHRSVTMLVSPSSSDRGLLEFAAVEKWDFSILFGNNLFYESGDRSHEGLERDVAGLVRRLVRDFKESVIVLYTFADLDTFPGTVHQAGATAVLNAPHPFEQLKAAIEKCLPAVDPAQ